MLARGVSRLAVSLSQRPVAPRAVRALANLRVTIYGLDGTAADEISDLLLGYGALSAAIEEDRSDGREEQKIYGSAKQEVWDHCRLVALYPESASVEEEVLPVLAAVLGEDTRPRVETEVVEAQEWEQAILDSYQPVEVASGVWMVPDWAAEDALPEGSGAEDVRLILEPGLAFGTGEHPTTQLCVQALRQIVTPGQRVMDYGTGSGILAVAALRFGARECLGSDIDDISVTVAARNAELNGFGADRFRAFLCGPASTDPEPLQAGGLPADQVLGAFDVVVANILQGPVLDLCDRLAQYVRPGGRIILSGILAAQVPEVRRRYGAHFDSLQDATRMEWACVVGTRKSD